MRDEVLLFCPYCGGKLDVGATFCAFCGARLDEEASESLAEQQPSKNRPSVKPDSGRLCPVCGGKLNEESVFCGFCGARVDLSISAFPQAEEKSCKSSYSEIEVPILGRKPDEPIPAEPVSEQPLPAQAHEESVDAPAAKKPESAQETSKRVEVFSFGVPNAKPITSEPKREETFVPVEHEEKTPLKLERLDREEKVGVSSDKPFGWKALQNFSDQKNVTSQNKPETKTEPILIANISNAISDTDKIIDNDAPRSGHSKNALALGIMAGIALCVVVITVLFLTGLIDLPRKEATVPYPYSEAEQSVHEDAHGYYMNQDDLDAIDAENRIPYDAVSGNRTEDPPQPSAEELNTQTDSPEDTSIHFPYAGKVFYADVDTWLPAWYGIDVVELLEPESARSSAEISSSNPAVAAVDSYGKVWYLNEGTAVITAAVGKETASFTVEIVFDFAQLDYKKYAGNSPPDLVENTCLYQKVRPDSVSVSSEMTQSSSNSRFDALMAVDGDIYTCWQENAYDDGRGEWICLNYDSPLIVSAIAIWPGYWKSDYLFNGNAKPLSLMIRFDSGACVIFELKNSMECVTVMLNQPVETRSVCVKVLDVWPGDIWNDLAISEIAVYSEAD